MLDPLSDHRSTEVLQDVCTQERGEGTINKVIDGREVNEIRLTRNLLVLAQISCLSMPSHMRRNEGVQHRISGDRPSSVPKVVYTDRGRHV